MQANKRERTYRRSNDVAGGAGGACLRPCQVSLSLSPTLFQAAAPFRRLCSSRSRRSSTTVGRSSGLFLSHSRRQLSFSSLCSPSPSCSLSLPLPPAPSLALAFRDASNGRARVNAGRPTVLPRIAEVVSSKSRALDACLVILSTPARRTVLARRGRREPPRGTTVECTHGGIPAERRRDGEAR